MEVKLESELYLLSNVPLRNDYQHTIDFDSIEEQSLFFERLISNVEYPNDDYSYIRETETINVDASIDDLISCNYLFYDNGGKRYYAFITEKEYVRDKCTAIHFEIDVLQTFMFDYTIGETFIEREHQNRYSEIENNKLKPIFSRTRENLERGNEFYLKSKTEMLPYLPSDLETFLQDPYRNMFWVTLIAKKPLGKKYNNGNPIESETTTTKFNYIDNNIYTYVFPVLVDKNNYFGSRPKLYLMENEKQNPTVQGNAFPCFRDLTEIVKDSYVISMNVSKYAPFEYNCLKIDGNYYIYPLNNIPLAHKPFYISHYSYNVNDNILTYTNTMYFVSDATTNHLPNYKISNDLSINKSELSINNAKNINYEPKLKTVDYEYLQLEIGDQKVDLSNENFDTNNIEIEYLNTFSAKGSSSFTIKNYDNQERNFDKSLIINSLTHELPLLTDEWLNYLRNNKNSIVTGLITGAVGTVGGTLLGLATGGIGLAVAGSTAISYGSQIANQLAQYKDMQEKPKEIKNTTYDLTLDILTKGINLQVKRYSIHNQFLQRIFNYFYHYGYMAQYFNIPNLKSRYYFNYIKTVDANIISNIDNNHIDAIKSIFDNGITIWHYRGMETWHGVGNYSYENVETNLIGGNND